MLLAANAISSLKNALVTTKIGKGHTFGAQMIIGKARGRLSEHFYLESEQEIKDINRKLNNSITLNVVKFTPKKVDGIPTYLSVVYT